MNQAKLDFLKNDFIKLLRSIDPDTKPAWGKMNLQQMIEHFSGDAVRNANGRLVLKVVTPAEHLPKMQEFMMSEKPFKENTKNVLLGDDPLPTRNPDLDAAINELQDELNHFFEVFEKNPSLTINNPFFGELDYAGNVQLLHKHALHHLRQFGVSI